jgi:hypothetical protein
MEAIGNESWIIHDCSIPCHYRLVGAAGRFETIERRGIHLASPKAGHYGLTVIVTVSVAVA